jgi:hypothetical protein
VTYLDMETKSHMGTFILAELRCRAYEMSQRLRKNAKIEVIATGWRLKISP